MQVAQNLHTHTSFCDGKNTVREMAQSAQMLGLSTLGFSGHAYTPHDESYCMKLEDYPKYRSEILKAAEEYRGQIELLVGLEQDYYAVEPTIATDFLIGSVHYVEKNGIYTPVDETKNDIITAVKRDYDGDIYAFLEAYFALVGDVYDKTGCDIVGHIDLCEKFNADGKLFDRESPRYIGAYKKAVDRLIANDFVFEINTGAMSRGYTDFPYPHENILTYIVKCGGRIIMSSDSHSVDTVGYMLDEMCEYAKKCGFTHRYELRNGEFVPVKL